jgi:hypothetical protein
MTMAAVTEAMAAMSSAASLIYVMFQLTRSIKRAYWRGFAAGLLLSVAAIVGVWILLLP